MTSDELRQYVKRRPFQPFRIRLDDGTDVLITRTQQMTVMDKQFVAAVEDRLRFFPIERVRRVEDMQLA
jgi:hypothetical protein